MTSVRIVGSLNIEAVTAVPPGGDLHLDLSATTFAYPSGLVAVLCLARDAANLEVTWPEGRDLRNYLARMSVDRAIATIHPGIALLPSVNRHPADLCEVRLFSESEDRDDPVDLVRSAADASSLPGDIPWMLEEGTYEICDNALTHGGWSGGGVIAAQMYRARNEIEYAVGDAGVGMLATLRDEYPSITDDAAAILKASEYGVTRFGQDRRGAGLSETIDQVTGFGGRVVIRSGVDTVTFERGRSWSTRDQERWRGTLVKVIVPVPG